MELKAKTKCKLSQPGSSSASEDIFYEHHSSLGVVASLHLSNDRDYKCISFLYWEKRSSFEINQHQTVGLRLLAKQCRMSVAVPASVFAMVAEFFPLFSI